MKNYNIGIDLGTTNSAICSYDGEDVRVWKSPDQRDVTPSAIHIDKRGRKRFGMRAYQQLSREPERVAAMFKRFMGSNTKIEVEGSQNNGKPEEWSAEILKVLYGYLPEEIRPDEETGIVITVPAAFDEMQKVATMEAANAANLGNVALMQEPVAAVMAAMRRRQKDGTFLIYDLGGGTLDIVVAQSIGGRVQLLSQGGIGVCGGRDIDRLIVDSVVIPYLEENFDLPSDFVSDPKYKKLMRAAPYYVEEAKIELSSKDSTIIASSDDLDLQDDSGTQIFLEIPITNEDLNRVIADLVSGTIAEAKVTIKKAGLEADEIDEIVFIGGPTNYKPLRDRVSAELGITANINVNPMTAVAEGAAIFAESIDWSSSSRLRKSVRGQLKGEGIHFNYNARTPGKKAKIVAQLDDKNIQGAEFEVTSLDTGWNSGRISLKHGAAIELDLPKKGTNKFKVNVFDTNGAQICLADDTVIITRSAATVDAIPASHSIGIEIDVPSGGQKLDFIVRAGDQLPKKGSARYRASQEVRAGQAASLTIRMWEGEIENPIDDNRLIGALQIDGSDFEGGVIHSGDEIICEYEILDSGEIRLAVSMPTVAAMVDKNFYSRQQGQVDYAADTAQIQEVAEQTIARVDELEERIDDPRLMQARNKLEFAQTLNSDNPEIERNKEATENIYQARKLLYQARQDHRAEIRRNELENYVNHFDETIREYARPQEATQFDNLVRTARNTLDKEDASFESYLAEMHRQGFRILWRQNWFVESLFRNLISSPMFFRDKEQYKNLTRLGEEAIAKDNYDLLRTIIGQLHEAKSGASSSMEEDFGKVNIYKA